MKTYDDLAGDGGSNIVDQVQALGVKLRSRLDRIKHKVALMSGKGGVGKSSLTANVAACLVDKGYSVGILDADLNGPSICHLLGVRNSQKLVVDENGVQPGTGIHGIKLMSMDMLLSSPDSPVMWTEEADATAVWVSTMESTALRELVADTDWGDLDYLLIDMPPGSDRIDNIRGLIPELAGVVEITIPSMLSQHIVAKSITKNNKMKVPILGLVENMAGYTCPHCEKEGPLFEGQDVEELAKQKNIPYIGKIPFDTRIGRKTDSGSLFYMENKDSVTGKAIGSAVDKILDSI
ncbi:MAG: P-loop NTPase [Nitrospinaceae bacterium]|jgi:ATP-binding protein involved in chromosome partitioning|nr:P-loop NTPase [Nitrospinaceae bacterium]MDP6657813.1 P-loop NTPase [Nitrospinaceae bacterium]MDP6712751.1 P-loop NTPase [Nitrospinaceae bacterium]MDP7058526.1 P-loop NTPase [Nitrospinaceae bacterium]|tara:strand:+ start:106 stop:984 length:879 start_codon:yes stop_codon:yes gene_type:complete